MRGEIPYVLYQDGKNFSYVIQSYQDGTWQQLTRGSELSQYQDFTIWGDRLYLAYTTGSFPYGLHVSAYDLNTGEKTDYEDGAGDVCNLSIGADAVLLGRWLRREQVSLANWRAGDLDGSGMLNGADLTMLRRMLTGT